MNFEDVTFETSIFPSIPIDKQMDLKINSLKTPENGRISETLNKNPLLKPKRKRMRFKWYPISFFSSLEVANVTIETENIWCTEPYRRKSSKAYYRCKYTDCKSSN